jgi:hypothetical protein
MVTAATVAVATATVGPAATRGMHEVGAGSSSSQLQATVTASCRTWSARSCSLLWHFMASCASLLHVNKTTLPVRALRLMRVLLLLLLLAGCCCHSAARWSSAAGACC